MAYEDIYRLQSEELVLRPFDRGCGGCGERRVHRGRADARA
jgi:hypothetical protein